MLKHNRTRTHCIEKALFTFEFIFANTFSPHGPLSSTLSFLSVHLQLAHPTRIRQLNGNVRPFYLFRCVQFLKFYLSNFQLSRAPPQLKSRTSCLYCKPPEHSDVYNHFHCKHKQFHISGRCGYLCILDRLAKDLEVYCERDALFWFVEIYCWIRRWPNPSTTQ